MRKTLFFLMCLALLFSIIFAQQIFKEPLFHRQSYVFGTLVDISIYGETDSRATELTDHIFDEFQILHGRLQPWKRQANGQLSELQDLNDVLSHPNQAVHVQPDLVIMLQEALQLSKQSQGLFNPAIGQLIQTWGFQRDEFSAIKIDAKKIDELVQSKPSLLDLIFNGQTVMSRNAAVNIDLGGYAKGYALDQALVYLKQQNVKNALINIGGNIIALGQHGDHPWRVGIQHPRQPSAMATLDLPSGWSIGTSGDYQRYFELNGQRYCHLIDPRTGYPVQHTQAVTVLIAPQDRGYVQAGVLSDVASKPIFIAEMAKKAQLAQSMGVQHFLIIDQQGKIFVSKALLTQLRWVDSAMQFHVIN